MDGTSHGRNQLPLNSWLMESWQSLANPKPTDYSATTESSLKGGTRVDPTTNMSTLLSNAFMTSLTKPIALSSHGTSQVPSTQQMAPPEVASPLILPALR